MNSKLRIAILASTVCMSALNTAFIASYAHAQSIEDRLTDQVKASPDAQMFIQSDVLVYDNDQETVSAEGNVQVDYDGYQMIANKITYNQKSGRLIASGKVIITEPNGHKIFADKIDVTEDFKDGFINSLRIETPDDTRFSAEHAERVAGEKTIFTQGAYTACKPCAENPEKPPFWQVKAKKVILDGVTNTVRYEKATFELFGKPIAYLDVFQHASPSSKKKSGFLRPKFSQDTKRGFHLGVPYYFALAPNYDLTVTAHGYSRQGFLGEAEWRHRLENGTYTLKIAGIHQLDPEAFTTGSEDRNNENRGMIASTGKFHINPKWSFGWDVMGQSDRTFSRTYDIGNYSNTNITSNIYLKGLDKRSYFDLSAYRFIVQESNQNLQERQALVHPSFDYNTIASNPIAGGELGLDVNVTSLTREKVDLSDNIQAGVEGNYNRATFDLHWKSTYTNTVGMSFTPFASLRGDGIWLDNEGQLASNQIEPSDFQNDGSAFRYMPTVGLEMRWPILATTANARHVIEPIGQILLRPDLAYKRILPNEDSQSLVFDATNLFSPSKFSGYDRIESGTRANVGLRYSGTFDNGLNLNALIGQSYHLSGDNPYTKNDLVLSGGSNGLETDVSDYVAMLNMDTGAGWSVNNRGRFDEKNFDVRRFESELAFRGSDYSGAIGYAFIDQSTNRQFEKDRHQVNAKLSVNITDEWRLFGALAYDIRESEMISDKLGIEYLNDCFSFNLALSQSYPAYSDGEIDRSIFFSINFRTLGTLESSQSID
jgi:LPS-assembly protein